jgi:hypothetical protein
MKKFIAAAILSVGVMVSACGGGSPNCDALKKQCDACTGTAGKAGGQAGCNTAYTTYTSAAVAGAGVGDASCKSLVDLGTYKADSTSCK